MSAIFLKLSGERLREGSDQESYIYGPKGLDVMGSKLQDLYDKRQELGINGITIVPGGGNIFRGRGAAILNVKPSKADAVGRGGTIINAVMFCGVLETCGIDYRLLIANNMRYEDPSIETAPYTAEASQQAYQDGKVVVIGGGTGEDNMSTDQAVVWYANDYRQSTEEDVIIFKGTQTNGVFDSNPDENPDAKRYKCIGAQYMLDNYKGRFEVVDERSLQLLVKYGLSMVVYRDEGNDVPNVLRHMPMVEGGDPSQMIGTLVVPGAIKAQFYPANSSSL